MVRTQPPAAQVQPVEYLVAEAVLLQLLLSNYLKSHLLNEKIGNLVILYIQPDHHSQLFLDAALP